MKKEKQPTTGFRNGNLFCFNCGASYNMNLPQPVSMAAAIMKQFHKSHKSCKKTWVEPVADPDLSNSNIAIGKNLDWWLVNGERGMSSETMASQLSGRKICDGVRCHPSDPDDFRRCYLLLQAVPQWKAELDKMRTVSPVWNKLVDNWDRLSQLLESAMKTESKSAKEMYELMQEIGC